MRNCIKIQHIIRYFVVNEKMRNFYNFQKELSFLEKKHEQKIKENTDLKEALQGYDMRIVGLENDLDLITSQKRLRNK